MGTRRHPKAGQVAHGLVILLVWVGSSNARELEWFGGTHVDWPTHWAVLAGLNDGVDPGVAGKLDFVGDATNPGAYYAFSDSYVYFRVRMNVATVSNDPWNNRTYSDTVHVLVDQKGHGPDNGLPDYGFSWDSNQQQRAEWTPGVKPDENHGLEMTVLATPDATTWGNVSMDDWDGSSGQRLVRDINGADATAPGGYRTGEGYIRTIDSQSTTSFDDTTFIDFAVSWDYLTDPEKGNTTLAPGQTWRIALATIANSNDHAEINADVAGGASTNDLVTMGWSDPITTVPEPSSIVLVGIVLMAGWAAHGLRRRKK